MLVWMYQSTIEYWRSFDAGVSWVLAATETASGGNHTYRCAIEQIGNRIVHVYGWWDTGDGDTVKIYAMVSIDNGTNWIDVGLVISDAGVTSWEFDLDLYAGKVGWLYLGLTLL